MDITGGATLSACRRYRYALWRSWEPQAGNDPGIVMFVCLNPSTADETSDDPTIRRCIAFARSWGFHGLCVANLFAFRATRPAELLAQADPVGTDNDRHLRKAAAAAAVVVAAWGVHGVHMGRGAAVRAMLPTLHTLRLTRDGHPGHPLYLPRTLEPVRWTQRGGEFPR
jgi:hypothetical protein